MSGLLRTVAFASALALAASAAAQQSGAPAALLQAVSTTQAAKAPYAFDFELDSAERTWRARFEPNATPRLQLVQPSASQLDADERRAFERMAEQMEGVGWCASEGMARVRDVRLLREDETTATYAFQPTRESVRGEQAQRFANRLRGEMTLTKANPDIARLRIYTPEGFSPMPFVQVDRINVVITCQTAPNGRRYAAETVSEARGSAFGAAFDERSIQRTRNLDAAR